MSRSAVREPGPSGKPSIDETSPGRVAGGAEDRVASLKGSPRPQTRRVSPHTAEHFGAAGRSGPRARRVDRINASPTGAFLVLVQADRGRARFGRVGGKDVKQRPRASTIRRPVAVPDAQRLSFP